MISLGRTRTGFPLGVVTLGRRVNWRQHVEGYLLMLPWLVGFIALTAGPMLASLYLAVTSWDLLTPPSFAGWANFERLWGDELFWNALYNTAYYTCLGVPLHLAAALLIAMLLNRNVVGMSFFRTCYYIPTVTPAVASALLWAYVLNSDFGVLNLLLRYIGLPGVKWLADPEMAKPAFILMGFWSLGGPMLVFLAGLQGVPQSLYEAASIDGAGSMRRFLNITLPMMSPVIFFNLVLGIIGSFQVFTAAYIMTDGGPRNATLFLVLMIYRHAFKNFRMGYASALAWMLFLIVLVFTVIQFRLGNRWVYYEVALGR